MGQGYQPRGVCCSTLVPNRAPRPTSPVHPGLPAQVVPPDLHHHIVPALKLPARFSPRPPVPVLGLLLGAACAAAGISGCGRNIREAVGSDLEAPGTFGAEAVAPILGSFAPTSVRLHPLSRWDAQAAEPTLLIYVELLDDSNDPVKWPASVTLTITPSGGPLMTTIAELASATAAAGGTPADGAATPVRFRFAALDASAAARTFDPVSRSYLARLTGLPRWAKGRPQVTVDILSICPLPPDSVIELEYQGVVNPRQAAPAPVTAPTPPATPAAASPDGM